MRRSPGNADFDVPGISFDHLGLLRVVGDAQARLVFKLGRGISNSNT
jgi:hypothetical protein